MGTPAATSDEPGCNAVTLTAIDSNGNIGEATLTIHVSGAHDILLPIVVKRAAM